MTLRVGYVNMFRVLAPWRIKLLELVPKLHPLTMAEYVHYCRGACAATAWMMASTRSRLTWPRVLGSSRIWL